MTARQQTPVQLDELQNQVDELMGLLTREGEALAGSDIKQIDRIVDRKRVMVENLLSFAEQELAQEHAGTPEWNRFLGKLTECRKQNLINGGTMSAMSQSRDRALRVLYGLDAESSAYASNGQTADDETPSRDLGSA